MQACLQRSSRLINLPNQTYDEAAITPPMKTNQQYWLGMKRTASTGKLADYAWVAGNETYSVVQDKFISVNMPTTYVCFYLVFTNKWSWSGLASTGCMQNYTFICQFPVKGNMPSEIFWNSFAELYSEH